MTTNYEIQKFNENNFISRCKVHILDLHLMAVMHMLVVGLHLGKFLDTLANIDELHNQATLYQHRGERTLTQRKRRQKLLLPWNNTQAFKKRKVCQ